jgi:hypothetical protein
MVSAEGFSAVNCHSRKCSQGVASVLCKKTPIFGSWRSNLDHLTVRSAARIIISVLVCDRIHGRYLKLQKRLTLLIGGRYSVFYYWATPCTFRFIIIERVCTSSRPRQEISALQLLIRLSYRMSERGSIFASNHFIEISPMIYPLTSDALVSQKRSKLEQGTPNHLSLDRSPNIGPLICRWKLEKFKNCWNKSFRTSRILTLL